MGHVRTFCKNAKELDLSAELPEFGGLPAENNAVFLHELARHILVAASVPEVLTTAAKLVANCAKWATCDVCFLYLLQDGDLILHASQSSCPEAVIRLPGEQDPGRSGWLRKLKEPFVVVQNASRDPRVQKWFRDVPEAPLESFLSVPIVARNQLIGIINLGTRAPRPFTSAHIESISTIALLVGIALEVARLEEQNAKLNEQLKTRKIIERAKGILQRQLNLDEQNAYLALQRESCRRRKSMKDLAEAIILAEELKGSVGSGK